jgi:hypothetical protein
VLSPVEAAALEALRDPRIGPGEVAPATVSALRDADPAELAPYTVDRLIEWATRTLRQGDILAAFAAHCRDELEDVEVLEAQASRLVARWRRETSVLELRAGLVGCERLASERPTMLLTDLDHADVDALAARFAADPSLRSALAVYDLGRLEKISAVRSSVFVYLEWFLRDAYGVKFLPSAAFTQGLVARGVISLGFG